MAMKNWLIQRGLIALKKGKLRIFFQMVEILLIVIYAAIEENTKYYISKSKTLFDKSKMLKINGSKMLTMASDRGISRELVVYGIREKFLTDYIKRAIGKYDHCVDIGANLGYYTLLEARKATDGTVYAFEPDSGNFSLLQRNMILNNVKNVIISDKAIADISGSKTFYLYPRRNWSSFNDRIGVKYFKKIVVETVKLDRLYKQIGKVNFIRMDVEGYEVKIIEGAKKLLKESTDLTLAIEIHPHLNSEKNLMQMLKTIRKSGFLIDAIMLEVQPRHLKYLDLLNRYRQNVGVLPYGLQDKKNNNYDFLEDLLFAKRNFNYYPHVVFKKGERAR